MSALRPADPAPDVARVLELLRDEVADRVRERAAIIHAACPGTTWDEADRLALEWEARR